MLGGRKVEPVVIRGVIEKGTFMLTDASLKVPVQTEIIEASSFIAIKNSALPTRAY